jgi:uracil-DNA glycosylase family 4
MTITDLFKEIQECKISATCKQRHVRQFYFENEHSNLKIMFICETPASANGVGRGDIRIKNWNPDNTPGEANFYNLRKAVGLESAYITNVVKCGGPVKLRATSAEISICCKFLQKEINLIGPKVIVCVGNNAEKYVKDHVKTNAKIMKVYHYSPKVNIRYNFEKQLEKYKLVREAFDDLS